MGITMIAWDTRVCKSIDAFGDDTNVHKLWVDGTNPISDIVTAIGKHLGGDKLSVLRVYGHGILRGGKGAGVQFGKENITGESLHFFMPLKGHFESAARIELRSCKAGAGADQLWSSTYFLYTALAIFTEAFVYAAEEIQVTGGGIESARTNSQWTSNTTWQNEQKQKMSLQTTGDIFVISPFLGEPVKRLHADELSLTSGGGRLSSSAATPAP
jgi:hypothetical protein